VLWYPYCPSFRPGVRASRFDLADTVDKLHSRVSPQAIKEEVKAYAREASYDLIHNLERPRARKPPPDGCCCGRLGFGYGIPVADKPDF
jgi:Protein of unknown function (DUF3618)